EEALSAYKKAEELGSNRIELQLGIGLVYLLEGTKLDEAARRFEGVLQKDPGTVDAAIHLAAVEMARGHLEPALKRLQGVRGDHPAEPFARLGEARCLFALKRYGEARQSLEKGCQLVPTALVLPDALARLLSACPEASERDGQR